ncbi:hypothetical protein CRUP_030981 [Coryphaenoides rupestris]|nr:hypothetical protein CRUP_030981 [Coryphaenoides rupestris]
MQAGPAAAARHAGLSSEHTDNTTRLRSSSSSSSSSVLVVHTQPDTKPLSALRRDPHAGKLYLSGRGEYTAYLSEQGQPYVSPFIERIKKRLSADPTLCVRPASPFGLPEFIRRATQAALGNNSSAIVENRTVGFTGAVRLGAELLRHWYTGHAACHEQIYLSSPCDESLPGIFQAAGMPDVGQYRYWDAGRRGVCIDTLLEDLERVPERSVVVLSASAHWPTGADLSREHWVLIAQLMMRRQLFPFLLLPAQGLCYGDLERDAWPHVGHLLCVLKQSSVLLAVRAQTEKLVNALWAQPPVAGACVVATVLSNPAHLAEWQEGVRHMAVRCMLVRERLREKLRLLGTPGCWDHLTQQTGLYCCTGLSVEQIEYLSKRKHIHLLPNGCLNVSAVNSRNLDYITESLHEALSSPLS